MVIAATCLPALVLTGKDITGHASILWLSTNIFQNGGWEAMSPYYSSSPYFQIDPNVVPPLSSEGCSSTDCTIMQDSTQKEKEKGSTEYSSKCTLSTKSPVAHEDSHVETSHL